MKETDRDGADAECADVGERGDRDGDARLPHRLPDPLRQGERRLLLVAQVAQALHDDEHVVDPDPCNGKRELTFYKWMNERMKHKEGALLSTETGGFRASLVNLG